MFILLSWNQTTGKTKEMSPSDFWLFPGSSQLSRTTFGRDIKDLTRGTERVICALWSSPLSVNHRVINKHTQLKSDSLNQHLQHRRAEKNANVVSSLENTHSAISLIICGERWRFQPSVAVRRSSSSPPANLRGWRADARSPASGRLTVVSMSNGIYDG